MILPLDMGRSALVLTDMQHDFLHEDGVLARLGKREMSSAETAAFLQKCARLVELVRSVHRPVIFTKTQFRPDYADCAFSNRWLSRRLGGERNFLVEGSVGVAFMDELQPESNDYVILKKGHGGFHDTPLDRVLTNLGVDQILLAGGGLTDAISTTARKAAQLGYVVHLVEEAIYPTNSRYKNLENLGHRVNPVRMDDVAVATAASTGEGARSASSPYVMVIIDMQGQKDETIVRNNQNLAAAMRRRGWPVIFVRMNLRPDGQDDARSPTVIRGELTNDASYWSPGAPTAAWVDGLEPEAQDVVVDKKGNSGFGFTPLHRILRNRGIHCCIVTGGATGGCVSDTVREGVALGYQMTVVSDATYERDSPYLDVLADFSEVRTTESVLSELQASPLAR